MSYAAMAALAKDPAFQDRVKAAATIECQQNLDNPDRADWSNMAYDTLRNAEHAMDSFTRMVAQTPGLADQYEAGDQSAITDEEIQQAVNDSFPIVASLFYMPNGIPWTGAIYDAPEPPIPPEPEPEPVVTGVTPTSGPGGSLVDVTGTNLAATTTVNIGQDLINLSVSDTMVSGTLATDVEVGVYDVVVTSDTAVVTAPVQFEVTEPPPPPTPEVTGVDPTSGPQQSTITITGVSLTGTTKVNVGKDCTSFTVVDDATVTAVLGNYTPPQKGTFPVIVTVDGVQYTGPNFTVT